MIGEHDLRHHPAEIGPEAERLDRDRIGISCSGALRALPAAG